MVKTDKNAAGVSWGLDKTTGRTAIFFLFAVQLLKLNGRFGMLTISYMDNTVLVPGSFCGAAVAARGRGPLAELKDLGGYTHGVRSR